MATLSPPAPPGAADHAKGYPRTGYAIYVLAIFSLAAILSYTDRLILNVMVDPIRHDLHITDTQVSLLQGMAFAVLYACISLPLGRIADRYNRRNVILFGILVWSAATAACGYASSFGALFAARIGVGLGEAALAPAAMSMIADYFPPHRRGFAIAVFLTGMGMGGGTAVMAGGALLQAFSTGGLTLPSIVGHLAPWREVMVALALPGAPLALLLLTIGEPARQETLARAAGATAEGFGATLRFFSQNRWTFGFLFTAFALGNMVGYARDSWLPTALIRRFAMAPGKVGFSLGLVSLIFGGGGTVLGGLLSDRMERGGRLDAGLRFSLIAMVCGLPLLAFSIMPSVALTLALYGAIQLVQGMAGVAGLTATQNAVPGEMRGFAVSMQAFMYTLIGLGLGPTAVAFVTDHLYHAPKAVGLSIFTVSVPVSMISATLVWRALGHYRRTRALVVGGELAGAAPPPASPAAALAGDTA
jgi:MFS family permease